MERPHPYFFAALLSCIKVDTSSWTLNHLSYFNHHLRAKNKRLSLMKTMTRLSKKWANAINQLRSWFFRPRNRPSQKLRRSMIWVTFITKSMVGKEFQKKHTFFWALPLCYTHVVIQVRVWRTWSDRTRQGRLDMGGKTSGAKAIN